MNITRDELKNLTIQVARNNFGSKNFKRRKLMLSVEKCIRSRGYWTPEDDVESGSAGRKSKGLANIDWAVSTLKQEGRLLNPTRDQWRVP